MIYVSEDQLAQVEYLIGQSIIGNHILFDYEEIKRVFRPDPLEKSPEEDEEFSEEHAYEVEHHIEKLILEPTLAHKKAYLEKLDQKTFNLVVRTYFNIVENSLFEQLEVRH